MKSFQLRALSFALVSAFGASLFACTVDAQARGSSHCNAYHRYTQSYLWPVRH